MTDHGTESKSEPPPQLNEVLPIVTEEDYWKTAHRYLDIAKTTAAHVSTISITWLVSVLLCLWAIDLGVGNWIVRLENARSALSDAHGKYYNTLSSVNNRDKDRQEEMYRFIRKENSVGRQTDKQQPDLEKLREALQKTEKDFEDARSQIIKFNFPAIPAFEVPTQRAPTTLSGIILLLVIYLSVMRERTFRYLGQGLRILREDLKVPRERIGDVLSPRSWWILPLPRKAGEFISPNDFAFAIGWNRIEDTRSSGILTFWLVVISLQLYLIHLTFSVENSLLGSVSEPTVWFRPTGTVSGGINFLFLGITISTAVWWLLPIKVPDTSSNPVAEFSASRRRFLTHSAAGLGLAIAVNSRIWGLSKSLLSPIVRANPRYRKKHVPTVTDGLRDGLLLNRKSGVIHAVSHGRVVGLNYPEGSEKKPKVEKWQRFPNSALLGTTQKDRSTQPSRGVPVRINQRHVSIITELAFRKALEEKQYQVAQGIMSWGLERDVPAAKKFSKPITIDMTTKNPLRVMPRRKPRKRHKGKQSVLNKLSFSEESIVRWFPRVSFRLYDLMAKSSVELHRTDWVKEMVLRINRHNLRTPFEDRMTKWTDPNSKWHQSIIRQGRSSNVG